MIRIVVHGDVCVVCIIDNFEFSIGIILCVCNSGIGERAHDPDGYAVARMKGVDRIVVGLNWTIRNFGVLDDDGMSGRKVWQHKNERYRELHIG